MRLYLKAQLSQHESPRFATYGVVNGQGEILAEYAYTWYTYVLTNKIRPIKEAFDTGGEWARILGFEISGEWFGFRFNEDKPKGGKYLLPVRSATPNKEWRVETQKVPGEWPTVDRWQKVADFQSHASAEDYITRMIAQARRFDHYRVIPISRTV